MKDNVITHCLTKILPKKGFKRVLILLLISPGGIAQRYIPNPYPLKVVKDIKQYQQVARQNPATKMADLKARLPSIVLNLIYATKENFTGQQLYPEIKTTYLRLPVSNALVSIQQELKR